MDNLLKSNEEVRPLSLLAAGTGTSKDIEQIALNSIIIEVKTNTTDFTTDSALGKFILDISLIEKGKHINVVDEIGLDFFSGITDIKKGNVVSKVGTDLYFQVEIDLGYIYLGSDRMLKLSLKNSSSKDVSVSINAIENMSQKVQIYNNHINL